MSSRLAAKMQASPTMLVVLLQLHDGLVTGRGTASCRKILVIASEAKQSSTAVESGWIAASLRPLPQFILSGRPAGQPKGSSQ
jgi:hypothetical protein